MDEVSAMDVPWLARASTVISSWGRIIPAILGLGFLRAWLGWMLGALRDVMPETLIIPGFTSKLCFDFGELLGAALCVVLVYRFSSLRNKPLVIGVAAIVMLLGSMGSLAVGCGFPLSVNIVLPLVLFCGMSYLVILLFWTEELGFDSPVRVVGVSIGSYFVSSVFWFYTNVMPFSLSAVTALAALLLSFWFFVQYHAVVQEDLYVPKAPFDVRDHYRIFVWVWAFALSYGVGASFTQMSYATAAAKAGTMLPALLIVPYVVSRDRFDFSFVYRISFLSMIVGFLFALISSSGMAIIQVFFSVSQALVMTIALTFACGIARIKRISAAAPYGIISIGWYVIAISGRYISTWVLDTAPFTAVQDLVVVVVVILLLAVVALFLFREVDFVENWKSIRSAPDHEHVAEICEKIAEDGGLSKRETSVLLLVVQGVDQKEISERLFIAPGTVRAHIGHIYDKLDVHSLGDLHELFDRYR